MKNIIGLVLVLAVCAVPAAAQNTWDWSHVGGAGVIDANNNTLYVIADGYLGIRTDSVATAEARYPVTNTVGSLTTLTPGWTTLEITVHDQYIGDGSVTAVLYEVDKCSGTQTQLCEVVSEDTDQDTHCNSCTFSGGLDFANNAYYVHATVAKTSTTADPRLYAVAIY
jgi:hypothetical protein